MIIFQHSAFNAQSIGTHLGAPEYSYWFVRNAFRPVLERLGIVIPINESASEVDRYFRNAAAHDQPSVFFSFNPPHATTLGLQCPTVPVFAWEFDTIPNEVWLEEPRHDWTAVLRQVPAAVTHSQFAVTAIRNALGSDYPVWSIPAPIYQSHEKRTVSARGWREQTELTLNALVIDAGALDLSLFSVERSRTDGVNALKTLVGRYRALGRQPLKLSLGNVVYTAVFNPVDSRKNWNALVAGFIWAFRDNPEATLLIKTTHHDSLLGVLPILSDLERLGPFKCRVLIVHGLLPAHEYESLIDVTSFIVNSSCGEGQCLPLMEFMSAGRPAITPLHTAMLDYVNDGNSFVIPSTMRPASWPHDPRLAVRCMLYIVRFGRLVEGFRKSFEVAKAQPQRYAAMSVAASVALKRFCSDEVVIGRLRELFQYLERSSSAAQSGSREQPQRVPATT